VRRVVVLSGGKDAPASWEVVDVELPSPPAKDQQLRAAAIGVLVDRLQLLSGAATERHSTDLQGLDLEAELAAYQQQLARPPQAASRLPTLSATPEPGTVPAVNGLRDTLVIFGCVVFIGALLASVAGLLGLTSGDATNAVVAGGVAGFGLGLALTALIPGSRRE